MRVSDCLVQVDHHETEPVTATLVGLTLLGLQALQKMTFGQAKEGLAHIISVHVDHLDMAFTILDDMDAATLTLG